MAAPTVASVTGYGPSASGVTWTPFSGQDFSAYKAAVFVCTKAATTGFPLAVGGSSSTGWQVSSTGTDGSFAGTAIFYQLAPTASETLQVQTSTGAAVHVGWLILVNHSAAVTILNVLNGSLTNPADPPSIDTGAVRDFLTIAVAVNRNATAFSAGPSGYANFNDQPGGAGWGAHPAVATKEITAQQTEDPGTFTGGATGNKVTFTAALYLAANSYNQSVSAATSPVAGRVSGASKAIGAATSAGALLVRSATKAVSAATSAVASVRRAAGLAVSRTTSPVASERASATKAISRTTSPAASVRIAAAKAVTRTTNPAAIARIAAAKAVSRTTSPAASARIGAAKAISRTTSPASSVSKGGTKAVTAGTSPAAILRRAIGIALSVRGLFSYIIGQNTFNSAGLTAVAGYVRPVSASTSPAASERASATKAIARTTSPAASVAKSGAKAIVATVTPAPALRFGAGIILLVRGLFSYTSGQQTFNSAGLATVAGYIRSLSVQTTPTASGRRSVGLAVARLTAPGVTLATALAKHILAATIAPATMAINAGVTFTANAVSLAQMRVSAAVDLPAATVPTAGLRASLAVFVRTLAATVAELATRFFEFPSDCNTIILASQDRIIVIECDPKTYEFPARYTAESMLYGADFAHRLEAGETIVTPMVTLMDGDLEILDVQTDGRYVTFRMAGGSPIYQRLAIAGITDNTPANILQAEAVIACYP